MLTVAVPVFVTLTVWVVLLPTATFPNETLDALGLRMPEPEVPVWPPPPLFSATDV